MNLEFFVRNRKLTRKGLASLIADTLACDTFTIDFDKEWDDLVKVVVLRNGKDIAEVLYTGKMPIPRQVCGRGDLYLTCHGYRRKGDDVAVVRTMPMVRPVRMVGSVSAEAENTQPYTPTAYAQMAAVVARAEQAAAGAEAVKQQLLAMKEAGEFQGAPGPAGPAATIVVEETRQGDAPVVENLGTERNVRLRFTLPGKYVLTQEDKQEIVAMIDGNLETLIGTGELQ